MPPSIRQNLRTRHAIMRAHAYKTLIVFTGETHTIAADAQHILEQLARKTPGLTVYNVTHWSPKTCKSSTSVSKSPAARKNNSR